MNRAIFKLWILLLAVVLFVFSSNSQAQDGQRLYKAKCISCHNADPSKKGAVGPDIADSSLKLIKLKTQKKEYPKGYTPKRKTKIMPVFKLDELQIKALHQYISSFNKGK